MTERWSIIVHGGARTIPADAHHANRAGCHEAVAVGAAVLRAGGTALDAAVQAVRVLEDDATFNAGRGAVPNADGDYELDAAVMEGTTLGIGAVAALRDVPNAVDVARLLLDDAAVLLVGDGALAFARAAGIAQDRAEPTAPSAILDAPLLSGTPAPQHDTVGCVALDADGRMAVATSTGGLTGQRPGRVGDAPIAGCGFYIDDAIGGVAISGDGESIIRITLASRVMRALEALPPAAAARTALASLARVGGEAGIIALDSQGRFGVAHNSAHFAVAMAASHSPAPRAGIETAEIEDLLT